MKKLTMLLILTLAVSPVSFADMHEGPGMSSVVFNVLASPSKENPPIPDAQEAAEVTIEFNIHRNEMGEMDMAIVDYRVSATLGTEQTIRAMHIHVGGAGVNGPVVIDGNFGAQTTVQPGTLQFFRHIVIDDPMLLETIAAIVDNPGGYYYNLHTTANPGGHFRGQLVADTVAAVDMTTRENAEQLQILQEKVDDLDVLIRSLANSLGLPFGPRM